MFRRFAVVAACATVVLSSLSLLSRADDPKPATPQMPSQEQMEQMQKMWEEAAKPGDEHKKLAETAGEWTADVEDYSAGQPMKSTGTAKFTMLLGGRYLQQEFKGSMNGEQFEGIGIVGYDNLTKQFQEIWIDSMGTAIYVSKGSRLDDKTTEAKGKMTMPGAGEMEMRSVAKHADKDHMTFEMYGPGPDGKEMLFIKISYTRKM